MLGAETSDEGWIGKVYGEKNVAGEISTRAISYFSEICSYQFRETRERIREKKPQKQEESKSTGLNTIFFHFAALFRNICFQADLEP